MSLSARISLRASRRLELVAACMAIGGVVVVAITAAARWPTVAGELSFVAALASFAIGCYRVRSDRAAASVSLAVADRAEIAVFPVHETGDDDRWRLDDSTMMWPGFSVIGLRRDGDAAPGGRSMRLTVFDDELGALDRRSLHRFLLWSLRGGRGDDASTREDASR